MKLNRASGILLHITSLPGRFGIGDLGQGARNFVDFLKDADQKYWQILPLGPTGFGDSPYQTFSAFAGNPILIDPIQLVEKGLLSNDDIAENMNLPIDHVDYGKVIKLKKGLLHKAYASFDPTQDFEEFCNNMSFWLDDYALFSALKDHNNGAPWNIWLPSIKLRNPAAVEDARNRFNKEILYHKFVQFIFFQQWDTLKKYANKKGVSIIGDIPIFVAFDSADAWSRHNLFQFDEAHNPTAVAGVPPDFFSETGQLWGNPLYDWEAIKAEDYNWWLERMRLNKELFDIVRVDHFRGFAGYWSVPAGEKTAVNGQWVKAPGTELFTRIKQEFGEIPIIAEDLGIITDDVIELRDRFDFPGMKILQFAFGSGEDNPFLPHNFNEHCVVYTGTHDNSTTEGWFKTASKDEIQHLFDYLPKDDSPVSWQLIKLAWSSKAALAIAPMQDILALDDSARMNTPSIAGDNWQWRCKVDEFSYENAKKLRNLTWKCER